MGAKRRTTELHFDINLTDSQRTAYDLVHKAGIQYVTLAWSRQSGKSTLMEMLCIEWLVSPERTKIAYVCRSYLLAKKVYKEILSLLPRSLYDSANGSDLTITRGQSSIQFYSSESGSALRGNTFDYLICDEFAFFKFDQPDGTHLWYDILSPTVKVRGRKVIFVSTPLGDNLFKTFFDYGLSSSHPTWTSMKRTIYDDGLVTEGQIEDIKSTIPELSFRQEYLVEFLDDSFTFFTGYADIMDNVVYEDIGDVSIGIDFSSTGEDRTVLTKINGEGRIGQWVIEGTLDRRYRQLAELISCTPRLRRCLMESNSIGTPMGNEVLKLLPSQVRRKCGWFTTTNNSKDEAVSALAVAISNKELAYSDEGLRRELRAFRVSWSKSGRPIYSGAGEHDDRVMSLAIALKARQSRPASVSYATVRSNGKLIC